MFLVFGTLRTETERRTGKRIAGEIRSGDFIDVEENGRRGLCGTKRDQPLPLAGRERQRRKYAVDLLKLDALID